LGQETRTITATTTFDKFRVTEIFDTGNTGNYLIFGNDSNKLKHIQEGKGKIVPVINYAPRHEDLI